MDVDPNDFSELQQQAAQLTADMHSGADLPRVERNLAQILEAGQRLLAKVAPISQDSTDVKASILLGSKGYDVPNISQKLEGLSAAKTFESLEPVRDTDIQGFLRNERENALLAVIEQTRRNTFEETERRHWECMENEWEREKQKILNALLGSGQDTVDFQPETESFLTDTISMKGHSNLDNMELAYARQVYTYNEQVIQGSIQPSLVDMFQEAASTFDNKHVSDLWAMVKCMVDVPPTTSGHSARLNKNTQKAFIRNARSHLEQVYKTFISGQISGNLQQAQLGGVPGTYNLVKSYLNIRQSTLPRGLEDGLMDGHPTWALLYYCLRCGDLKAAQNVVKKAGQQLGDFPTYLQEYITDQDNRLSPGSETKIQLQYRRVIKQCPDPFKRAVYCIIGQCDYTDDHPDVADKIDDYLWLKLCQIQTEPDDTSQDQFTLQKLQTLLFEDFGEGHFNGYQQPFLYFQVLFLTAQFEAAVEFLSRIEKLRCHAVHVALVLYKLKLLLVPSSTQAQLLSRDPSDPSPMRRLNLARLVMMYTRKFEETDPREALQYFYFLREMKTSQNENLFMTCVCELVRETKEYEMLLGKLLKDGTRKAGAVDKFQLDTQRIIEMVAHDTEAKGAFEDAVRLYDLAKKADKVLELLNKLLSQVVSQSAGAQSNRDRLKNLALGIAERYRGSGAAEATRSNTSSFFLILDLITFFDLYHQGQMEDALGNMQTYPTHLNRVLVLRYSNTWLRWVGDLGPGHATITCALDLCLAKSTRQVPLANVENFQPLIMRKLQLLPLTTEAVEHKVNTFRNYTDEVRRCLPDVLLASINILHSQYKNMRNTAPQSPIPVHGNRSDDGGKETYLNYLRSQAKALIMFAGMLPYRLPGDTYARLVQIEVLMN